jgi:murein DD-endopeptidase MepM/ murein hydrolase activator NlpD
MSMDDLQKHANLPLWHDGEGTKLEFRYPLPIHPLLAGRWTLRGWKYVSQHQVVATMSGERYGLLEGIPAGEVYERDGFWCARSPQSHIGPFLNAIDFLVPDGIPVLASQEGEILEVVEHNDRWGDGDEFRDTLNFITLVHASGELTQYCHLARGSVAQQQLRVGSGVKMGQRIGTVGKTGWTDRDHLHFIVFRDDTRDPNNPFGFKSLVPRFRR